MSPVSDLDVDGFSGHLSRRRSVDSGSDSAQEKQHQDIAARRASHNAVERQRRDRLNARILELASMLPNLAGVRRPSRIAITKSSIAYIHSARKQRVLAAQHLRALHAESEVLRAEVNKWRQRAGMPGVQEPHRNEAFMMVFTGAELEIEPVDACEEEDFDGGLLYPMQQRARSYSYPYAHGYAPSSSSSSSSGFPSPYSTSPSSADFNPGYASKFDMSVAQEPRIACPVPANGTHFEAQQYMLQTDEEWAAIYGAPPTHFQDQPHGSW